MANGPDEAARRRPSVAIMGTALVVLAILVVPIVIGLVNRPAHHVGGTSAATFSSVVQPLPSPPTSVRDTSQISGFAASVGSRALTIRYVGGDCDIAARAYADETGQTITVHVLVTSVDEICEEVGYSREVVATLQSPWDDRRVVDIDGDTVPLIGSTPASISPTN